MFVRNWMTKPVITIDADECLEQARALMNEHRVRRLPVLKKDRLVGILTRSDVEAELGRSFGLAIERMREALMKTAEEVMTPAPITVAPDDQFERACTIMMERKISGIPVVEDGHLVGMITETDIFRAIVDMMGLKDPGVRVVLGLPTPDSLVPTLQKLAPGVAVRAIVTYHDPETKEWKAVVRLRGRTAVEVPADPQPASK